MICEYFVICEGQTDFEILKKVISEECRLRGDRAKTIPLFPPRTGNVGGWDSLRTFLMAQNAALAGNQARIAAARLLGAKPAGVQAQNPNAGDKIASALKLRPEGTRAKVALQIDTDVAEFFLDGTFVAPDVTFPLNAHDRKKIAMSALLSWLGGHSAKVGSDIIAALCTHAMETWILASHPRVEVEQVSTRAVPADFDSIRGPDYLLASLGYASENDPSGKRRIKKKAAAYAGYGDRVVNGFGLCKSQSSSLLDFCASV